MRFLRICQLPCTELHIRYFSCVKRFIINHNLYRHTVRCIYDKMFRAFTTSSAKKDHFNLFSIPDFFLCVIECSNFGFHNALVEWITEVSYEIRYQIMQIKQQREFLKKRLATMVGEDERDLQVVDHLFTLIEKPQSI
jgi:hypothetical protein